jgi:hypothetical protein
MGQALDARFFRQQAGTNAEFDIVLCGKRLGLGDATALEDYVGYLQPLVSEALTNNNGIPPGDFQLMWEHPDDPLIKQAAEKIFVDKNPVWQKQIEKGNDTLINLLTTPLIGLSSFRQTVEGSLNNTNVIGRVAVAKTGRVNITRNDSGTQEPCTYAINDPLAPAAGVDSSFRMCDYVAFRIASLDGFPSCRLYWPVGPRDQAVAACRTFLQQYGDDFKYGPGIRFSKLDHTATPEDVKQGRAIFSLSGQTRVYNMPEFPIEAWRPSHQEDPFPESTHYGDGTWKDAIFYQTGGHVWQAEEKLVNGNWERYYGFAGRYQLEKVPAAEITFSENLLGQLSNGLSFDFNAPRGRPTPKIVVDPFSGTAVAKFIPVGDPLPVSVGVRNNSGLDQKVPDALMLPAGATNTLPAGIGISVSYSPKLPPLAHRYNDPAVDLGPFQELPMRKKITVSRESVIGPTLKPTKSLTVLKIDLRDYFDMIRRGSYRVKALFHVPGQPDTQSDEVGFSLDHQAAAGEPLMPGIKP